MAGPPGGCAWAPVYVYVCVTLGVSGPQGDAGCPSLLWGEGLFLNVAGC